MITILYFDHIFQVTWQIHFFVIYHYIITALFPFVDHLFTVLHCRRGDILKPLDDEAALGINVYYLPRQPSKTLRDLGVHCQLHAVRK